MRVFISYAHDDQVHEERVRKFWRFLREQGIDARVDLPEAEHRQDWPEWMTQQVRDAERVLVVVSPEYRRRAEGDAGPNEGRGVQWEARLIRDRFYADQQAGLQAVIPVVLPGCSAIDIPLWLGPAAATHYLVSECSVTGAEKLLRLLTGQPWEIEPPLGKTPILPSRASGTFQPGPSADAAVAGSPGRAMTGDPPARPHSSMGWWHTMTRSQQVVAAVVGGIFVVIAGIGSALILSAPAGQSASSELKVTSSPSFTGSSRSSQGAAAVEPSSCPSKKATWYEDPVPLPAMATTSLVFCAVDVNNGQPIEDTLHLSGIMRGSVPHGDILALVSWPDPSTCAINGAPGSGMYYFQTLIDPLPGSGYWQWTTQSAGPGNQTIKRYIYFVLAPESAMAQLKSDSNTLPGDARELAYITAQGTIPLGHHC